jgi:hypothetical protein
LAAAARKIVSNLMKAIDARRWLGAILIGGGLLLVAIYLAGQLNRSAVPTPQPYLGPLVPTAIGKPPLTATLRRASPTRTATATAPAATPTASPTATSTASATRTQAATLIGLTPVATTPRVTSASTATRLPPMEATATAEPVFSTTPAPNAVQVPSSLRERTCVGVAYPAQAARPLSELRPGWHLTWATAARPGAGFAQMVRTPRGAITPKLETIAQIAQSNPGALWLIGNEMDVVWQDNATPEQYAAAYHDVYATLKQADPSSRVAIGGVSEPTPLRLRYLDRILQVYRERYGQAMPIDVWNVHNFILPEQRGSWGVDIPPGMAANSGVPYTIDQHDSLEIFKQQLIDFRRWLAARGYRDKELIVSEYGILMYEDYGFSYERVRDFMLGSFDVMLNTTDASLGLPADENRLVQRWCWYSLADTNYPTGNLSDLNSGELTPLGRDFKAYLDR